MSLRLRFFAFDADEDPAAFHALTDAQLDAAARSPEAPPAHGLLVHLAVLSAADADEDALGELCRRLELATGADFNRGHRCVVPMQGLGSFSATVRSFHHADPAPGWLAALRRAVELCCAGYAHLGWDVWWDEAGVSGAPDEQATLAQVVPSGPASGAIARFFGLTAGDAEGGAPPG
jgi:hypothetical protein